MKLTAEQGKAINDAIEQIPDNFDEIGLMLARRDAIFQVGYRLGFEAAREAAAKVCDAISAEDPPNGAVPCAGDGARECAERIHAIQPQETP